MWISSEREPWVNLLLADDVNRIVKDVLDGEYANPGGIRETLQYGKGYWRWSSEELEKEVKERGISGERPPSPPTPAKV